MATNLILSHIVLEAAGMKFYITFFNQPAAEMITVEAIAELMEMSAINRVNAGTQMNQWNAWILLHF